MVKKLKKSFFEEWFKGFALGIMTCYFTFVAPLSLIDDWGIAFAFGMLLLLISVASIVFWRISFGDER